MKIIINADDCGKSTAVAGGLIFSDAKKNIRGIGQGAAESSHPDLLT